MACFIDRADNYWLQSWRTVFEDTMDVINKNETLSPSKLMLAIADRVMFARGRFEKRRTIPLLFYVVALLHLAGVIALLSYPLSTQSRKHDGLYIIALGAVYLHWVVFYGECIMSWAEKALYYKKYTMGDAPLHCWFMDALPLKALIAISVIFSIISAVGISKVLFRSLIMRSREIIVSIKF